MNNGTNKTRLAELRAKRATRFDFSDAVSDIRDSLSTAKKKRVETLIKKAERVLQNWGVTVKGSSFSTPHRGFLWVGLDVQFDLSASHDYVIMAVRDYLGYGWKVGAGRRGLWHLEFTYEDGV
jgi:hypothetical protein